MLDKVYYENRYYFGKHEEIRKRRKEYDNHEFRIG